MVALRKESVDRNTRPLCRRLHSNVSLSARRAWIEMHDVSLNYKEVLVALRKESVDRNILLIPLITLLISRSPQGERG